MFGKRLILAIGIIFAVSLFFLLDLRQYMNFDVLTTWVEEEPFQAGLAFALIYVLVTGLSIPGAGPLSLVAGAVFGLWYGMLIVSFASTLGATIAMLISRLLLQEWVRKRFTSVAEKVDQGVKKDGVLYLFTLRLIPPIPFFVINLVFGLTKMRAWVFYLVSQLGMLPATVVYVNAGASLGAVEGLSFFEVFTPNVILSFAALIAFPFIVKLVMKYTRFSKQVSDVNE